MNKYTLPTSNKIPNGYYYLFYMNEWNIVGVSYQVIYHVGISGGSRVDEIDSTEGMYLEGPIEYNDGRRSGHTTFEEAKRATEEYING